GFAKTGQTLLNLPDATVMRLYVDDEPLFLPTARLHHFQRTLDLRAGILRRELVWELPSGKQVEVKSTRLVSYDNRHLVMITYQVRMLNSSAPVVVSSQIVNREHRPPDEPYAGYSDPRRGTSVGNALMADYQQSRDGRLLLGYQTKRSGMHLACGADHEITTDNTFVSTDGDEEHYAKVVYTVDAEPDRPVEIVKYVAYHTSTIAPSAELVDRVRRTLDRATRTGAEPIFQSQREYLGTFWNTADVEVDGAPQVQQAVRWNLFQLAQAAACAGERGIPAKGLTGTGYEGHYFWDMEIYCMPFYAYTSPRLARNLAQFRYSMLDRARERAAELSQKGAMFPWRTINGEEASAYYEAGTAQYHINAAIAYAIEKYIHITGDTTALAEYGAEILVETARLWVDLGFFSPSGRFHIHGVTGPDEYTTLVNDNTYTNLMARQNLRASTRLIRQMAELDPEEYESLATRVSLDEDEIDLWVKAADAMTIPFNEERGIHPQDYNFLDKEVWDLTATPPDKFPLLLHYHPLVIYRYQVIKQADVVLAMFLLNDDFTDEAKQRNFVYYDPLTTGDSSLSPSVQSIIAAELGDMERAMGYFRRGLYMDLCDIAANTKDGVHVAATGGVWLNLVSGFGGLRNGRDILRFEPRLPEDWECLSFSLLYKGQRLDVVVTHREVTLVLQGNEALTVKVSGQPVILEPGVKVSVQVEAVEEAPIEEQIEEQIAAD
ncbi:MAG TPA: glycosyl hydrolase family 65 protein, partial [Acidimicrobiia bacterium]|nr:glycosyl hydrolase family 65 protein [Acidimicrobiia bacterium]